MEFIYGLITDHLDGYNKILMFVYPPQDHCWYEIWMEPAEM